MDTLAALRSELTELALRGPRARLAAAAALSTGLAVAVALWLRLDAIWWAGLSAFACSQAGRPASLSRASMRIVGTLVGAAAGLLAVAWLIDDRVPCLLALAACGVAAIAGMNCSAHGYAWLLGGITGAMVLTSAMPAPELAVHVAAYRSAETVIGALAALIVAYVLHDGAAVAAPGSAAAVPWSDLLGGRSPVLAHALRTGLTLALVPLAWTWLELPGLTQMAVSVAAVMAVPATATVAPATATVAPAIATGDADGRGAVLRRGIHRMLGCACGGVAGLAVLALPFEALAAWLALLMAGVWLCAHLNQSTRGVGYVGLQANVAYVLTVMQGPGPPGSVLPGVDRLIGMMGGLGLLLLVLLVSWPANK